LATASLAALTPTAATTTHPRTGDGHGRTAVEYGKCESKGFTLCPSLFKEM